MGRLKRTSKKFGVAKSRGKACSRLGREKGKKKCHANPAKEKGRNGGEGILKLKERKTVQGKGGEGGHLFLIRTFIYRGEDQGGRKLGLKSAKTGLRIARSGK